MGPQPYYFGEGGITKTDTIATELTGFLSSIEGGLAPFNTTNLATVLVAGVGLAAAPAICWFAYRFVKGKVTKAVFKGKL